jgi:hypothetical protein
MSNARIRLSRLEFPARALVTLFVVTMGAGYFSALVQLHTVHPSREDVVAAFHGSPTRTRLVVMAEGDMRPKLKSDAELATIRQWVVAGARRESFEPVRAILAARCIRCHAEGKEKEDAPLETFEDVQRQVKIEPLISTRRLTALTHMHVLGMGCLFGILGAIFCATAYSSRVKLLVVGAPFLGMALDFSSWWLARVDERFCDVILAGGALTGIGLAGLVLGTLADLWVRRSCPSRV